MHFFAGVEGSVQARADREKAHDPEEDEQRVITAFGHPEGENYSEAEDYTRPLPKTC
jgi:hypothetical protein